MSNVLEPMLGAGRIQRESCSSFSLSERECWNRLKLSSESVESKVLDQKLKHRHSFADLVAFDQPGTLNMKTLKSKGSLFLVAVKTSESQLSLGCPVFA